MTELGTGKTEPTTIKSTIQVGGVTPIPVLTNTLGHDVGTVLTPKVRKFLYPIAGVIGAAAAAFAPVFPGTIGQALGVLAAFCTALVSGVAVSHI